MRDRGRKEKRRLNIALTLLFAIVIFCTVVIAVLVSGGVLYLLIHFGVIAAKGDYLTDVRHVIWYMGFICVVVGSVLTMLTTTILLQPLQRMIRRIRSLAAGEYNTRLYFSDPLKKHPTFAALSESFNTLAEELENTEMLRSDFINNFSHEFKTPIISIAGFAKLLKRGNLSDKQKREYIDIIEDESLRLSYMATNVLNLTKVENQTILTDVTTYNLSEQIRSCILLLENRWMKKHLEFSLELDEYEISANEELLKQVFINLIDNAIKFSPEYGFIDIKIKEINNRYKITISNAGEEIPRESMAKIFNKFYQADESHASEGNGVGLAIVRKIVDLHEGDVLVKSENGITTFEIEL